MPFPHPRDRRDAAGRSRLLPGILTVRDVRDVEYQATACFAELSLPVDELNAASLLAARAARLLSQRGRPLPASPNAARMSYA
jgi:hypothetical protein